MKTIGRIIHRLVFVLAFVLVAAPVRAVEGLKLQVHCPDVLLSWPSVEGETYLVQHRPDLSTNSTWSTLTNFLPAATGTNLTVFVHPSQVDCPTGQIFGMMFSGGGGGDEAWDHETNDQHAQPAEPVVMPADGLRMPLPLAIYPPGIDLPVYIIIWPDGSTDGWNAEFVEKWKAIQKEVQGDPQTEGAGGEELGCGFYRVVRNGVHLFGLTNGIMLSGIQKLPIELGLDDSAIPLDVGLSPEDEVPQPPGSKFILSPARMICRTWFGIHIWQRMGAIRFRHR